MESTLCGIFFNLSVWGLAIIGFSGEVRGWRRYWICVAYSILTIIISACKLPIKVGAALHMLLYGAAFLAVAGYGIYLALSTDLFDNCTPKAKKKST